MTTPDPSVPDLADADLSEDAPPTTMRQGRPLRRLLAGRRIVLPATIASQAITLVRNTLVARLLGPEQYGLATTFLLAQMLIDSATDTGLNKFVLSHRQGNRPSVQATVQLIAAVRGVVIAALIVGIGYPVFGWLGLSDDLAPFALLALTSISIGLVHFDNARQQRNGNFANDSLSGLVGDLAALAATLAALMITHSYLVVLFGIAARGVAVCLVSHLLARRRYRLRYSAAVAAMVLAFSWPLLINGPLLFLSTQADRLFASALLGLRELGIYSATLLLVMLPLGLLTRIIGTLSLPRLSAAHHAGDMDAAETEFAGTIVTLFTLAATGFAALGPLLIVTLYGPAYALASLPVALIGLAQGTRFLRGWPSGLALASGRTGNVLLSNLIRLLALPLALAGVLLGQGITGMAVGLLLGESLALLISLLMLNRARRLPWSHGMAVLGIAFGVSLALPLAHWAWRPGTMLGIAISAVVLGMAIAALWRRDHRLVPRDLALFGW